MFCLHFLLVRCKFSFPFRLEFFNETFDISLRCWLLALLGCLVFGPRFNWTVFGLSLSLKALREGFFFLFGKKNNIYFLYKCSASVWLVRFRLPTSTSMIPHVCCAVLKPLNVEEKFGRGIKKGHRLNSQDELCGYKPTWLYQQVWFRQSEEMAMCVSSITVFGFDHPTLVQIHLLFMKHFICCISSVNILFGDILFPLKRSPTFMLFIIRSQI